jgi:hypothetical protein
LRNDLLVNFGMLGLLVGFSIWNQLNYLLVTWTPPTNNVLAIPSITQLVVRASIIPLFFMALAFLAPQARSIGESLNAEAHAILRSILKMVKKQTKRQEKIIKSHPDLDLSATIEAVAAAANEKTAGQKLSGVQRALAAVAAVAQGKPVSEAVDEAFGAPSAPTKKLGTPEDRCRRAYRKGMSWQTLMKLSGVSESTAKRWHKRFEQESQKGRPLKLVS